MLDSSDRAAYIELPVQHGKGGRVGHVGERQGMLRSMSKRPAARSYSS